VSALTENGSQRWRGRLASLRRVIALLRIAVRLRQERPLSDLEQAGLIQQFEMGWELSWKLMADLLRVDAWPLDSSAPRQVIRAAFNAGLVADGQVWLDAAETRNLLSHTYDPAQAAEALLRIETAYLPAMEALEQHAARRET
jgi:nucleotidyltransferase substrate binding protein (TIGR01987 family)